MNYVDIEFYNSGVKASDNKVIARFIDDIVEACNEFEFSCAVHKVMSIYTGTVRGVSIFFPLAGDEECVKDQ